MFPAYAEGETDEEGRFPRSVPRRDGLLILVDHPAYLPWAQPASATPAEIVLQPGRTWRGRLTVGSREHQKGRSCASWKQAFPAWRETRRWQRCGEVSTTGELSLTGLKDGEVDLDIQVPGFLHFRRSTTLPPRTPLKLLAGSLVTGRVVGVGSATGIPKALIRSEGGSPVESQADGVFAIAVAKLPAQIQVSAAGFRDLQVTAGKPLPQGGLVVRLVPGEQLRGTLSDEERKPVPKALLWIEEQTEGRFRSESRPVDTRDGAFTVDLQGPGRYRLRFQAEGFREEPLPEVSVSPGESRTLGAITLHRGGGLLGTAVDTLTREPLEDVEVELLPEGTSLLDGIAHQRMARTTSDRSGRFRLTGVPTGRYRVTLHRAGYAPAFQAVTLEADQLADLGELALGKGCLLRGRVVSHDGNPRPGLTVRLLDREKSSLLPLAEQATDSAGRFEGPRLSAGRYRIQLRSSRLLFDQEIEIPEGAEEWPLDLVAGGVHVTGSITREGEPVAGGSLSLSSVLDPAGSRGKIVLSAPEAAPEAFTYGFPETRLAAAVNSDGSFELEDVPEGTLTATYAGNSDAVTRTVTVPDAPRAELRIEIGGLVLRGQVIAEGQEMGIEAQVRVVDPTSGRPVAAEATNSDGVFAIANLQPALYTVYASADGYEARTLSNVEAREGNAPLRIALKPGGTGGLRVHLWHEDGTPATWVPLTLLDPSGVLVQARPTNGGGELELKDLPAGTYWLVWADSLAGAGASEPIRIEAGPIRTFEKVLPEGGSLDVSCDLKRCAGQRIEAVSILADSGAEVGPQISGASSALRFSAGGTVSFGRLTPGAYTLRLWVGGELWARRFVLDSEGVRISLP